jgi:hypothetical protein
MGAVDRPTFTKVSLSRQISSRLLQSRSVAAKLAIGLATVSLLTVPAAAAAAASAPDGSHASAPRGHRHHRRPGKHVVRRRRHSSSHATKATPLVPAPAPANSPFFSPNSIWNQQLPADAPLDPDSAALVNGLIQQEASSGATVQTSSYGVPIYTVGAGQPTVPVTMAAGPALNAAMSAVPMPANAVAAAGTDANLAIWQPSTDTMWEFWRLTNGANGWSAGWGGVMDNVSSDPGYYQNIESSTGTVLQRNSWGAPATSFPLVAGVMTISELESGQINHALYLALPNTMANKWVWPAQRSDGRSTASDSVPEGAHFRLDPNLNLASLHLPHFVYMMAVAAQKYGIIISNTSGDVAFRAQDPTQFIAQHGYNPYTGPSTRPGTPGALFNQEPSQMLRLFPWSHLQLLHMTVQAQPSTSWTTQ